MKREKTRSVVFAAIVVLTLGLQTGRSMSSDFLAGAIADVKRSVVPVTTSYGSQGTAVVVGYVAPSGYLRFAAVTCAHVVSAGVDPETKKPVYAPGIELSVAREDGTTYLFDAEVAYADPKEDFSVLSFGDRYGQAFLDTFPLKYIQLSLWMSADSVREGDEVLYLGYPEGLGTNGRDYPVARLGMISQIIPGRSTYLVDGFVQQGNSGGPVFILREDDKLRLRLAGLVTSYQPDTNGVVYSGSLRSNTTLRAVANAGLTYVVRMDGIIPALKAVLRVGK